LKIDPTLAYQKKKCTTTVLGGRGRPAVNEIDRVHTVPPLSARAGQVVPVEMSLAPKMATSNNFFSIQRFTNHQIFNSSRVEMFFFFINS